MGLELELGALVLSAFTLIGSQTYEVPSVRLEIFDNEFNVNIPDENGMQTVFYKITINDKCPTLMDSLLEPIDKKWISKFTGYKLNKGDELKVNTMVENNDEIYQKFELIKVNAQGKGQMVSSAKTENTLELLKQCDIIEDYGGGVNICRPTATSSTTTSVKCSGDVIFEENFEGNLLNTNLWTHEIRSRIQAQHSELVAYDNDPRNCYVTDGKLHIEPTWTPIPEPNKKQRFDVANRCTSLFEDNIQRKRECDYTYPGNINVAHPPVMSSKIHTRNSFSFKYGKVEVRAKMPIGDFLFPYIILQPKSKNSERLYVNYTRIAYSRGNKLLETKGKQQIGGRYVYSDIVYWQNDNAGYEKILREDRLDEHFGADFHTYSVTWQKNGLIFELDGVMYGSIRTTNIMPFNDEEFYIVIGVTVGGQFNFPKDINHKLANAMGTSTPKEVRKFHANRTLIEQTWIHPKLEIDYIRVTAIKEK